MNCLLWRKIMEVTNPYLELSSFCPKVNTELCGRSNAGSVSGAGVVRYLASRRRCSIYSK